MRGTEPRLIHYKALAVDRLYQTSGFPYSLCSQTHSLTLCQIHLR